MYPQQNSIQGIGIRAILIGIGKLFVWTWKLASFTGAWVFLVPIVIASNFGASVLTTLLLIACLVFCLFWTIKNWVRRKPSQMMLDTCVQYRLQKPEREITLGVGRGQQTASVAK